MADAKPIDSRDNPRDKSFTLSVYCQNCDFTGKVKISKGADSAHRIRHTECPNCGVSSYWGLQRSFAATLTNDEGERTND